MGSRHITVSDLVEVTGFSRHQLRNLLSALPNVGTEGNGARHATTFSLNDVALISVCAELEAKFGMRRDVIAGLCSQLRAALAGPKPLAPDAYLHCVPWLKQISYHSMMPAAEAGLLVPLADVVTSIDSYFAPEPQRPLQFGPRAVPARQQLPATPPETVSKKQL